VTAEAVEKAVVDALIEVHLEVHATLVQIVVHAVVPEALEMELNPVDVHQESSRVEHLESLRENADSRPGRLKN